MNHHMCYAEALQEAKDRNEIIVNIGDIVVGTRSRNFAIVADCGAQPADARLVAVVPPRGYGRTGGYKLDTSVMRYMGWIEGLDTEELSEDGGVADTDIENGPQDGSHAYALDASRWEKFEQPFWEWFRKAVG